MRVFVSGCFDMLHSGHVAFLEEAAELGDLYVALGSDATVYGLKGRLPVNSEAERLYMMQSLACVHQAFVSAGSGMLDFEGELRAVQPNVFFVNADGNIPQKEALCRELGIEYVVRERQPHADLPSRSTTALRRVDRMPYRIDLAGGWLDQPFVSQHHPGAVLTLSIEPTIAFNERSGMATSTRNTALDLWGMKLPPGDPAKHAHTLFCCDNPPGKQPISGSQDSIGIAMPGLTRADYAGAYWPQQLTSITDELTLQWIEQSLYLLPLGPREDGYNPLDSTNITPEGAAALADAADHAWDAIAARDLSAFGDAVRQSFEAQIAMFPHMVTPDILERIEAVKPLGFGWKLSGAGGGGYIIVVAEQSARIPNAVRVLSRRILE